MTAAHQLTPASHLSTSWHRHRHCLRHPHGKEPARENRTHHTLYCSSRICTFQIFPSQLHFQLGGTADRFCGRGNNILCTHSRADSHRGDLPSYFSVLLAALCMRHDYIKIKREEGKLGLMAIRLYDRCFICSRTLSFDYFCTPFGGLGQTGSVLLQENISVVLSRRGLTDMNK